MARSAPRTSCTRGFLSVAPGVAHRTTRCRMRGEQGFHQYLCHETDLSPRLYEFADLSFICRLVIAQVHVNLLATKNFAHAFPAANDR